MVISVENFVFRPYLRVSLLSLLPLRVLEKLRLSMSLTLIERKLVTVFCDCALSCNVGCSSSLHFHVKMMVKSVMSSQEGKAAPCTRSQSVRLFGRKI